MKKSPTIQSGQDFIDYLLESPTPEEIIKYAILRAVAMARPTRRR